ncbi:alpha/beta hydrolase [Polaribacter reichenbachii]|uniref:Alpha/beta hydrolase n=1 Tax=Polaribacter reichenbachii TaxID=996801 RepID=A0A1B8TVI6_9FLAO|nr:alpha/beta fold hydrolase [Polaribacter reichenbachii]APZ45308.1 alpha/beta hydrolase [Polaribacter reichenbachii]AUC19170.1 alpha/beta hydrolase [Polaribacter reichenbachii]OBY63673.1 alpha/beta hydrolase [Polaribacter reichenbachii]
MIENNILHSTIKGEGKPLLILHGYFGMSDNWKTLGNQFSEDYQVHLIDQRNHGRSFHSDAFNYELLAEDLYNYIQHYQLENVNIVGHSMGGKTAMLFAVTYPDLVDKLVIVDISPKAYEPHHNAILAGLNSVDFAVQNSRKLVDEQLSNYIPELGVRQFLMKNVYWVEKGQLGFRFNLQSLTENNPEVGKSLPQNTSFDKDTLFLKGEKSGYIIPEEQLIIDNHFPNHTVTEIANAGHWLHAENPKDFYVAVCSFLG